MSRVVEIAREILRIPSPTRAEAPIAEHLAAFLRVLGFALEIDADHNIVARLGAPWGSPAVILCGHHDHVAVGDPGNWTADPFGAEIRDGHLWGRGAVDAKGPLACILAAAEALARERIPAGAQLLVVSVREETNDLAQRGIVQVLKRRLRADVALVAEPTGLDLCLGHRGRVDYAIETRGRTAHGSMPARGVNAVLHMIEVVRELTAMPLTDRPPLGPGSQNVGVFRGGIQPNIVPDACRIEVDRRITVGETPETVRAETEAALGRVRQRIPTLQATFELLVGFEPSLIDPGESVVTQAAAIVREVTGRLPSPFYMEAHTDQEWLVNSAKIPTLILAPGDMALAHAPDERIAIAQLEAGAIVYTRLAHALLQGSLPEPPRHEPPRGQDH